MSIFKNILGLFLTPFCISCGRKLDKGEIICYQCQTAIKEYHENTCTFCGVELADLHICDSCRSEYFFDDVFSGYTFGPVIQKLVHEFKYNEFLKCGRFLAHNFSNRLMKLSSLAKIDYIIPVPLHRTKKRDRGFNQSDIIAEVISEKLEIPVLKKAIVRKKFTKTQTTLSKDERVQNVSQAFELRNPEQLKHKSVLLVDDVLTTGSTMKSIALLLRENLINKIYIVTLARA